MLRGVEEPLLWQRAPGLACLSGGRAGRAADASTGEAWGGAAPTTIMVPTRAVAASRGVTVRPVTEVAPAGAAALVAAKATTPAGATMTAVVRAALADSTVAVAASAAKVFLLRPPGGRPRLRGIGGVAAGSFTLFLLPNGWPRLRLPNPLGALAPAPLRAPDDDIGGKGAEREMLREPLSEEEE
jgi:hypothetical protein